MSGTVAGGKRAAQTNIRKFGDDYYRNIGRRGGRAKSSLKGFGTNRLLAKVAGSIGGKNSARKWTEEQRLVQGKRAKKAWNKKKGIRGWINRHIRNLAR